jgi:nitrogen regulatory protein P-II 1
MDAQRFRLVITIVDQSLTPTITDVVRQVGGQAITVVRGRGRDLFDPPNFLGMPIERERELLYLVVDADRAGEVARAVHAAGDLDRPGKGIVMVLDLVDVLGFVPRGAEARPTSGGAAT